MGKSAPAPATPTMIQDTSTWRPVITQLAGGQVKKEPARRRAPVRAEGIDTILSDRLG